jgi:hypothetical protein
VTLDRVLLTLATFAFAASCYWLMLRGWRSRQRRQGDLPAPPAPPAVTAEVLVPAVPGFWVGTTSEHDWLDRIAVHGLADRAKAELEVRTDGVHVQRDAMPALWMPFDALVHAGTGDALAGKYMGRDMLLVLTWRLGARTLLSGFRADEHAQNVHLAEVIATQLPTVREAS